MAAMPGPSELYLKFGGMEKCRALSEAFFARVPHDPVLSKVYPPHLRCAIEGVTLFLAQFLGGPCEYSRKRRWSLRLKEAHARFKIGTLERDAWLANMAKALEDVKVEEPFRGALLNFFERSSGFLVNRQSSVQQEVSQRWESHLEIERLVVLIRQGMTREAIASAGKLEFQGFFKQDRAALLSALALMAGASDPEFSRYACDRLRAEPGIATEKMVAGRTLLHATAATGGIATVELLLSLGADPNAVDDGGHAPLYSASSAAIVRALVRGGANVNANGGVQRCTALHMAARFGNVEVAQALLDCGADAEAQDKKGQTPLQRAVNCRKTHVAALLKRRG